MGPGAASRDRDVVDREARTGPTPRAEADGAISHYENFPRRLTPVASADAAACRGASYAFARVADDHRR